MQGFKRRWTTEEFIAIARSVHGDAYDYSRVVYQTASTQVEIICPKPGHGSFFPRPNNHISSKSGCPVCKGRAKTTLQSFLMRARAAHGARYDYSRVVYRGVQKKVEIVCPDHGPFWQLPMDHVIGRGCAQCGWVATGAASRLTTESFIRAAKEKHGERYDYSLVEYTKGDIPVTIICAVHGPFSQQPRYHLNGFGCIQCAGIAKVERDEFIQRSQIAHKHKYCYGEFYGLRAKAEIICPEHGLFEQNAKMHMKGHGCPECAAAATSSNFEEEVATWLIAHGVRLIRNTREKLEGLEIDLYAPDHAIGIECHGAYWHSVGKQPHARIHEHKANVAERHGLRLLTIWDFDWIKRREFVLDLLRYAFHLTSIQRVHARQCEIVKVAQQDAKEFYSTHHFQGPTYTASVNYGLSFGGRLVACLSCGQNGARRVEVSRNTWELLRFATALRIPGAASRLFHAFVINQHPEIVWSFSDRQWFSGKLYQHLGFVEDGRLHADYRLIHQPPMGRIWHKTAWQRKHIPSRLVDLGIQESFDPSTDPRTERDMQDLAGVLRIYDAGKLRWKWTAPGAA